MSAVGIHPSQLTILLGVLDENDGKFQTTTIKHLVQKCDLLHQKENGIDHVMPTAEKAIEYWSW
jgi:hypothetical protein